MESLERNVSNIDLIPTRKRLSIMGRQRDSLCTLSNVIYEKAIAMTGNGILPAKVQDCHYLGINTFFKWNISLSIDFPFSS